ncbi:TetR/AcrR family transcriptional regulator [Actinoplanes sp. NPDC051861]|uniref:TetR/AcrR family transcriptional regulator n=1 Tax=Actinoplanes sp. NPDC051861 TaxID=3155170 RepID=UPI0034256DF3
MARDGKRRIINGALELLRAEGGGSITLDATARQVGLTKPGLMYHFPTKEALMLAVVDHVAAEWVRSMADRLGGSPAEASASDRIRAYVETAFTGRLDRADFAIFFDAVYRDALTEAWERRLRPWLDLPDDLPDSTRARLTAARLAADGYWIAVATGVFAPAERDHAPLTAVMDTLLKDENH